MKDGTLGYDGWWPDSAYKKPSEAIEEAKYGMCLKKRPAEAALAQRGKEPQEPGDE